MDKGKKLCRRWYFDDWQTDEAEAWLESMAGQGWFLKSIIFRFAIFRQGDPTPFRYACVPCRVLDDLDGEEKCKAIFSDAGWKFVDSHYRALVFSAPEAAALPEEFQVNPSAVSKKSVLHFFWQVLINIALFAVFMLSLWYAVNSGMFVNYLLRNEFKLVSYLGVLLGSLIILGIYFARFSFHLRQWKARETEGTDDAGTRSLYRATINWQRLVYLIPVCISLLALFSIWIDSFYRELQVSSAHIAMVAVSDIVGEGNSVNDGEDDAFALRGLLYPAQVGAYESAHLRDAATGQADPDAHVFLVNMSYRAGTPWLASLLAEQLALHGERGYGFLFLTKTPIPSSGETMGFDRLWVHTDSRNTSIIALMGCNVYCLSYYGNASIETLACALKQRIAATGS